VPGADSEPSGPDQRAESALELGTDLEDVGDGDGLSVEMEGGAFTALQLADDLLYQLEQPGTKLLVRAVPLTVPVDVVEDEQFFQRSLSRASTNRAVIEVGRVIAAPTTTA